MADVPARQTNDSTLGFLGLLRNRRKKPSEADYRSTDQKLMDQDRTERLRSGGGDPRFELEMQDAPRGYVPPPSRSRL